MLTETHAEVLSLDAGARGDQSSEGTPPSKLCELRVHPPYCVAHVGDHCAPQGGRPVRLPQLDDELPPRQELLFLWCYYPAVPAERTPCHSDCGSSVWGSDPALRREGLVQNGPFFFSFFSFNSNSLKKGKE